MPNESAPGAIATGDGWNLEQTYARLPALLHSVGKPAPMPAPRLVLFNEQLAEELGLRLEGLAAEDRAALFTGQQLPPGALPLAQAYAGHQYGGFTMLGDGRAMLLGEQRTPDGRLLDVQFKGSGQTPYSRRGDGRAALGPMLREYIVSEAMQALGIPTTRSLAVAGTGEWVFRETPLPGAILTRVAASHIRVGTFQYLAARREEAALRALADYTIARHYPELVGEGDKYRLFLRAAIERQATLIARWQLVGFVHGVMNTDNMALSGETIDYGPCAFLDAYHPETVFSSIDDFGRYAYGNQPAIAQWNLARFAETLLPLLHADSERAIELAMAELQAYPAIFERHWLDGLRRKLGLATSADEDRTLVESLLAWMQDAGADFTNTFDDLTIAVDWSADLSPEPRFQAWLTAWRTRLAQEGRDIPTAQLAMRSVNPAVIPRNHRVEAALAAASERDDWEPLRQLNAVLAAPFVRNVLTAVYRAPPPPSERCYRTFCGT